MKVVKAVAPYHHLGFLNFKEGPYLAWKELGGMVAKEHYPWRMFHGLAYRGELPTLWKNKKEARLRFVEPVSLYFDTYPDYVQYEVIPMIWDCWPCYFDKMCAWLKKHDVRTAIFTSNQTAERIKEIFPMMNVMFCPEGIDTSKYIVGKKLEDRTIDVLEFGRSILRTKTKNQNEKINYVCTKVDGKFLYTNEQLVEAMSDAKVTIALPRSVTDPKIAGDIETLTQRYWECMLSRMVMVGQAPKELVDLIGYNPVVEINETSYENQNRKTASLSELLDSTIKKVLGHIEDYQELVDKNRGTALRLGDWSLRIKQVMDWLQKCGYSV